VWTVRATAFSILLPINPFTRPAAYGRLLPFEDKIIYDGLLAPYAIRFASGIRRDLNQAYRSVQQRGEVLTTLRPLSEDEKRAQPHWKSKDTDGVSQGSRRLEPWR
jgi:hypothetical protein